MIARLSPVVLSQCENQTRPLLPTTATMVISAVIALWAAAPNDKSLAADNPEKPNVVLVFADDKYEYTEPNAPNVENHDKNGRFTGDSKSPAIAANWGELRAINYTLLHCRQISVPAWRNWIAYA